MLFIRLVEQGEKSKVGSEFMHLGEYQVTFSFMAEEISDNPYMLHCPFSFFSLFRIKIQTKNFNMSDHMSVLSTFF